MVEEFVNVALIILAYATLWFIISLILRRNDVADIAWGLGYVVVCVYLFATQGNSLLSLTLYVLVALWGLRLTTHVYVRNRGKGEDYRYKKWRDEWGKWFYLRSYLQVYLLQGLLIVVIISPVVIASGSRPGAFAPISVAGVVLWLIGFYFETVGDYQLMRFVRKRDSKNEIMQSGLWKYTRHPNYFGETCIWWGIFVTALPAPNGIYAIISPLTITFLLLFVSGIPMLEERYKSNRQFQDYKKRTSAFFPMPPRS